MQLDNILKEIKGNDKQILNLNILLDDLEKKENANKIILKRLLKFLTIPMVLLGIILAIKIEPTLLKLIAFIPLGAVESAGILAYLQNVRPISKRIKSETKKLNECKKINSELKKIYVLRKKENENIIVPQNTSKHSISMNELLKDRKIKHDQIPIDTKEIGHSRIKK